MTQLESDLAAMGPVGAASYIKSNRPAAAQFSVILTKLKAAIKPANVFQFIQSDSGYTAPFASDIEAIRQCSITPGMVWTATYLDCDKFMRAKLGWLAAKGLGNLTIFGLHYVAFDSADRTLGGHALCLTVDDQLNFQFWDQDNLLYPVTYTKCGDFINATRIEMTKLIA